ncbi:MAG: amino acid permease [Acidobacteriota bacterium]
MSAPHSPPASPGLERRLNLFDATMLIVGNIIGIGIFTTTGFIADALPDPVLILVVWAVGGLLTLCGALSYAELGAALPKAGGEYVYLREAYGPFLGFLNGWTYFLVTNPGSIAAMVVGLIHYLQGLSPAISLETVLFRVPYGFGSLPISSGQLVALAIVLCFSAINYVGVRFGSLVQNLLTVAKLGAILAIALLGFLIGEGHWSHFLQSSASGGSHDIAGFSDAFIAVIFAYTGWFTSTYVASEIKEPQRNLPRSIIGGTMIVLVVYLLINAAYLYALSVEDLRGVVNVGEKASIHLLGQQAGRWVVAAIIVSILGAVNSVILTAPRIYYAMSRDGHFFESMGRVHRRFRTPANAIVIQALWSGVLVVSGTFGQLLTYTVVAMLTFSILTAIGVLLLRHKQPDLPRPYRTPGYPWIPVLFVLSYVVILANTLVGRPREGLIGLGIVILGSPVYFFWRRKAPLLP